MRRRAADSAEKHGLHSVTPGVLLGSQGVSTKETSLITDNRMSEPVVGRMCVRRKRNKLSLWYLGGGVLIDTFASAFAPAVEKMTQMVGSYAPKTEIQSFTTPQEDMPSGMLARGTYNVKSLFTDDDKHEHLKWEWTFEIKKDWED